MHTSSLEHADNFTTKRHGKVRHQTANHFHWPRQRVVAWLQEEIRKPGDEE